MVYELLGFSVDEIRIVEKSIAWIDSGENEFAAKVK